MEQITAGEAATNRIHARMRLLKSQVEGITLGITCDSKEPTLETLDRVQALIDRAIDAMANIFE